MSCSFYKTRLNWIHIDQSKTRVNTFSG
uniref:Uncharacterized protein n=1 Tax=Arundo donax TaxID=35708 RepID=A0A0A9HG84_ARUDO